MTKDQITDSIIQAVTILTQGETIRSEINSQEQIEEIVVESKNLLEANPFARIQMTQKADVIFVDEEEKETSISITATTPYVYDWSLIENNEKLSLAGIEAIISTNIEKSFGSFGAKIEVIGNGGLYTSSLDSSEMLGNINNFIFSLQKKIFDVSTIPDITQIRVTFYNNTEGTVTLHKFSLVAGHDMDKVDEESDPLFLYTDGSELVYTTNEVGETSINDIKLNARFVYKNERDRWLSVTEKNKSELPARYRVRWYKTSSDALSYGGDQWGGVYWSYFENEEKFSYIVKKTDLSADYEWIKFKVVIVDDEAGGVIAASSQEVEIRNKKIESAKYIKNISLNFLDGNNGGYPYYALDNQYSEDYSHEILRQRTIECKINSDFNYQTLYESVASIKWYYTRDSLIDFRPMELKGWKETSRREGEDEIIIEYIQDLSIIENSEDYYKSCIRGILKQVYQLPRRRKSNCVIGCEIVFTNGQKYEVEKGIVLSVSGAAGTDNSIIVRLLDAQGASINAISLGDISEETYYLQVNVYDVEGKNITNLNNCTPVLFRAIKATGSDLLKWTESESKNEFLPIVEGSFKNCFSFKPDEHNGYEYGYKIEITYLIPHEEKPLKIVESFLVPTCVKGLEKKVYLGPTKIIYDSAGSNPVYSKVNVSLEDEENIKSQISGRQLPNENSLINGIFTPVQSYDPLYNLNYSEITIKRDANTTLWHQPLLFEQNRYFSRIINEWDGNFSIDEDGNYILASAYVAGSKDDGNKFTGAVLGELGTITEGPKESGLFGYKGGAQTFGFKTDGTAFIGGSGQGRIFFDGKKGVIKSDNFNEENIDNNILTGRYTKGTFLNLQDGSFYFGGGRLRYNGDALLELDGQFNAVEGTIGGLTIANMALLTNVEIGENEYEWGPFKGHPSSAIWYNPFPSKEDGRPYIAKDAIIISGKNFLINAFNRPGGALSGFDQSNENSNYGWRLLIGANFGVGTGGMAATYAKITETDATKILFNPKETKYEKDGVEYDSVGITIRSIEGTNSGPLLDPLLAVGYKYGAFTNTSPFQVYYNGDTCINSFYFHGTEITNSKLDKGCPIILRTEVGQEHIDPIFGINKPENGYWAEASFCVTKGGKVRANCFFASPKGLSFGYSGNGVYFNNSKIQKNFRLLGDLTMIETPQKEVIYKANFGIAEDGEIYTSEFPEGINLVLKTLRSRVEKLEGTDPIQPVSS